MSGSSTDAPRSKRRRLTELGRSSHVTQAGLASIVDAFKVDGVPEHASRAVQYKARKERCSEKTLHGPLVEPFEVPTRQGPFQIALQNPRVMVHEMCKASEDFSAMVRTKLCANPGECRLVVYQDGVSPADGLAKHDRRKLVAFYWSFIDLGQEYLFKEDVWMVLACVRVTVIKKIDGGLPHLARLLCKRLHTDFQDGMDIVVGGGRRARVTARIHCSLMDEVALAEFTGAKGHAGFKPCMLCANVVNYSITRGGRSLQGSAADGWEVDFTCTDCTKFQLHTDESVRDLLHKLQAYKTELTADDFSERELIFGYNLNDHGILLDPDGILGVTGVMYDWMHVYLVNGRIDYKKQH